MNVRILTMVFAVASLGVISGCGGSGDDNTIEIGVAGPFSGGGAAFGEMIWGATLVVEKEIKAAGGIKIGDKTYQVKFVKEDDQSKPDQARTVADKLASNPRVIGVVGHFNSGCSLGAKPVYRDAKLPSISPGSTAVNVCEGSDYMFRNLYRDDYQGPFIAEFIANTLNKKKVGVFFDNDDYGIGLKDAVVKKAKEIGLEVVGEEAYTREQTLDFSTGVDKFLASAPDVLVVCGLYQEAAMIATKVREKNADVVILGGDGLDSFGLMQQGGRAAEGILITSPSAFTGQEGAAADFAKSFAETNGKRPDTWASLTYDALHMMLDGIKAVGPDRQKLRDWLATHDSTEKGWKGVTGITVFDKNGDCVKPAFVKVVKDGSFDLYAK
jgi:branched-chain amino acid transport system substrate-binding protein